jgi:hypothetical protein
VGYGKESYQTDVGTCILRKHLCCSQRIRQAMAHGVNHTGANQYDAGAASIQITITQDQQARA